MLARHVKSWQFGCCAKIVGALHFNNIWVFLCTGTTENKIHKANKDGAGGVGGNAAY